ncbi:MAG: 50S ribosomal protein L4 [Ignavibacteria bacterium]|jgi:large subunit ribosomal protein L4|nr:50S ribosomal protein L4 [Ignavibacteria bacterium]
MLVDIFNKTGNTVGQIDLADDVFAIQPNEHVMHQAVVTYLANQRQGTKKTKIRSEVSGGGIKPWKQKGRGGSRAGSNRSPLWPGGGTIHGPKPIDYRIDLPKKVKRLARKSALSARAAENNIIVIDELQLNEVKTKSFADMLKALKLDATSVLVLTPAYDKSLYLSSRNIPNVTLDAFDKVSTYDILKHRKLVIFKDAIEPLVTAFNN